MTDSKLFSTYNLVVMALSAALMAIGAWISLTVLEVPFTLQLLVIYAVLMLIGGKRGTIAIVVYMLLGLIGAPVFAGFTSGPAKLIGPTGGYLVGFVIVGILYWLIADVLLKKFTEKNNIKASVIKLLVCLVTLVVLYAFGTIWFVNVYVSDAGKVGYAAALGMCVYPFVGFDIAKIVVAGILADRTAKYIKK